MRAVCFIVACLCLAFAGLAQKIRFTDSTNSWTLLLITANNPGDYHTSLTGCAYGSDIIVSGVNYRELSCLGKFAIREDTAQGKIYFRLLGANYWFPGTPDTIEHVLFDYNLRVGDTLRTTIGKYSVALGVQTIDSVQLGGEYHRRWRMGSYTFIEGLGTERGPVCGVFPNVFGQTPCQLRCFTTNGFTPPCNPPLDLPYAHLQPYYPIYIMPVGDFDNVVSCLYRTADVTTTGNQGIVEITPNPGNTEMTLTLPSSISKTLLRISDMTGRTCIELNLLDRKTNIGQYLSVPGVYLYTLQDATTGQRYTGRFIFR